jgi:hypothetical protein
MYNGWLICIPESVDTSCCGLSCVDSGSFSNGEPWSSLVSSGSVAFSSSLFGVAAISAFCFVYTVYLSDLQVGQKK